MKKAKQLTPDQIRRAVAACNDGCSIKEVAERFGMAHDTMSAILHQHTAIRKQWNRAGNAA